MTATTTRQRGISPSTQRPKTATSRWKNTTPGWPAGNRRPKTYRRRKHCSSRRLNRSARRLNGSARRRPRRRLPRKRSGESALSITRSQATRELQHPGSKSEISWTAGTPLRIPPPTRARRRSPETSRTASTPTLTSLVTLRARNPSPQSCFLLRPANHALTSNMSQTASRRSTSRRDLSPSATGGTFSG